MTVSQMVQHRAAPIVNECSHYGSQAELVEAIRDASGRRCFASERCRACADIHCLWQPDCQQLSGLWFRLQ